MTIEKKTRRPASPAEEVATEPSGPAEPGEAGQTVGERLRTARDARGVDYYRIERDTKIRAKYLAALEGGDNSALPGDVYTKGFLRTYATYLGLNGDEIVDAWRQERSGAESHKLSLPSLAPLKMARRRFIFVPNHFFMVLLLLVVAVFGGYFVLQFARLLTPVSIEVSDPNAGRISVTSGETTYLLTGTATAGTTVEISWDGQPPTKVTVDSSGHWSYLARLHAGVNQFQIMARDAGTQHHSGSIVRVIDVPVSSASPDVPGLIVTAPEDGTKFPNDTIEVTGNSVAVTTVTVTPVYLGPPPLPGSDNTPAPTVAPTEAPTGPLAVGTPTPSPTPTPRPTPTGIPTPTPLPTAYPLPSGASPAPGSTAISKTVDIYGNFTIPMQLPPGKWLLTVTGINAGGQVSSPVTRVITVNYSNVQVVVKITGGNPDTGKTLISAWKNDGSGLIAVVKARNYSAGGSLTIAGVKSVQLSTNCAGATIITVNGWPYSLGRYCTAGTWQFTATSLPRRVY
jgi:hypothetical protein